jgi:hypothetical protein
MGFCPSELVTLEFISTMKIKVSKESKPQQIIPPQRKNINSCPKATITGKTIQISKPNMKSIFILKLGFVKS